VWNEGGAGATGGGLSILFARPDYQMAVGLVPGPARGVPDVAFPASGTNPGFAVVTEPSGRGVIVGGTSVGTPIWAGMVALLVERHGRLGLLNPELYRLGLAQPTVFHDVTMGNNAFAGVPGFMARPGYDLVTGWGSFDAPVLLDAFTPGCADDRACSDEDPCAANRCTPGGCVAGRAPDGAPCAPDECVAGVCQAGTCGALAGARGAQAVDCVLGNPRFTEVVCQPGAIPRGVTRRLDQVRAQLARTDGAPNPRRALRRARRLLAGAVRFVKRKKRFGATVCGEAVTDRLAFALAQLRRIENAG
jgi:hypothetical protein